MMQFRSVCIYLYAADPVTFLASMFLRPNFPLSTACLSTYSKKKKKKKKRKKIFIAYSNVKCIKMSPPKLHTAPLKWDSFTQILKFNHPGRMTIGDTALQQNRSNSKRFKASVQAKVRKKELIRYARRCPQLSRCDGPCGNSVMP